MTGALTWPHHLLTLADWDNLPEDNSFHVEVAEGILIVAPRPNFSTSVRSPD